MRHSLVFQMRPGDERPPTLLRSDPVNVKMAFGGVFAVLAAHLLVPGAFMLGLALLAASGVGTKSTHAIPEDHIVEARFVKLGKKLDPNKLPNRKVPIKTTAPQPGVAVSKEMEPEKPKEQPKPPPENAEEDPLLHLGDRAQAFAEMAEKQEQEGDPNGIEEGTETEAKAGDLYRGMLVSFFKRGWTIPSTLGDTSKLSTRASVEITADGHVSGHEIVRSSGEPTFDQSVEDRFNELRAQGTTLPEPPPEVADQFASAWTLDIIFTGRKAD